MKNNEALRDVYEYEGIEYVIRIRPAELDNTKYVPIIDWPKRGYCTIGSSTADYMCLTPEDAVNKGREIIHEVVGSVKFL